MARTLLFIAVALVAVAAGWLLGTRLNPAEPGGEGASALQAPAPVAGAATLPSLPLTDLDGAPVDLKQFEGRPVVLNLWATWCPPCRREMPVLERAADERPDVAFVFANQAESSEAVRDFLAHEGLQLDNMLLDPDTAVARHFQARGLPTTLFFNADGTLRNAHLGEVSRSRLDEYLNETR